MTSRAGPKINVFLRSHPEEVVNPRGGIISNIKLFQRLANRFNVRIFVASQRKPRSRYKYLPHVPVAVLPSLKRKGPPSLWRKHLKRDLPPDVLADSGDIFLGSKGTIPHAYIAATSAGGKLMLVTRDYHELPFLGSYYGKGLGKDLLRDLVLCGAWRKAYEKSALTLCNSTYLGGVIQKKYRVGNVLVDYPEISQNPQKIKQREVKKVSMVGGHPFKGSIVFNEVAQHFPDKTFYVYNQKYAPGAPRNVVCCPYGPINTLLEACDCMLVPSLWAEPFGRIAAESLIAGVPTFVSDRGGLKEVIQESRLRVEPYDVDGWVALINALDQQDRGVTRTLERAQNSLLEMVSESKRGECMDAIEANLR